MTSVRVKIALSVLILASVSLAATRARAADNEADTAAINKLFADFNSALNSHDAHAGTVLFTSDGDFVIGNGNVFHGTAAIEQHFQMVFTATRSKDVHRDVTLKGIRFMRPDMAIVYSQYDASGMRDAGGNPAPPSKGFYDWVVMKENGRWLISVWHESNLPTPQPVNSSAR